VAVDLALAQQSVELAARDSGEFACVSERENPLPIERESQFPSQNVVPLVLGDVQRIVNVCRAVSLGAVYGALAYYYDNIDEIRSFERANARARDRVHDAGLQPKDPIA
jgi:hypothetical protein